MAKKLKESSLADFSARLIKYAGLRDHEVRWYDGDSSRRVRSDLVVQRLHLVQKNLPPPTAKTSVATYLKDASALIQTGLRSSAKPHFFSADGTRIDGHTLIGRLAQREETQSQRDATRAWELVLQVSEEANESLDQLQADELRHVLSDLVEGFDDILRNNLSRLKKRASALKEAT